MGRPNEAFNCGNGDVFKWRMLASYFGVSWAEYDCTRGRTIASS